MDTDRCGTRAGYEQHIRSHTPVCEPCRVGRNAYMKAYRASHPEYTDRDVVRTRRHRMATAELVNRHYPEYQEILEAIPLEAPYA